MTAAVFDAAAIGTRRRELFPPIPEPPPAWLGLDHERHGSAARHCGICPKPEDETCGLSCETQRQALDDGVTVS